VHLPQYVFCVTHVLLLCGAVRMADSISTYLMSLLSFSCVVQYAWLVAHWAACIFYFIARQNNFTDTTWVGNNGPLFDGKPNIIR